MYKVGSFWKGVLANVAAVFCIHASHGEMPPRYVPLDWVEASGAQWVLTDYVPRCTDRMEMTLRFKPSTATQCLFCSRSTNSSALTMTSFLLNGTTFRFDRKTIGGDSFKPEMDTDLTVTVDFKTRECFVNGELVNTMPNADSFIAGSPLTLFASHAAGMSLSETSTVSNWAHYRFYSFRVYNAAGKLVREYVPALDSGVTDAISQCGVFETQTGVFRPNLGTQPFKSVGRADSTITLESDEDWSSLGAERYGKTIDLNGHNLRLGAIDAPAVVTNSAVTVGELRLDLAQSVTNSLMHVQGNVKLVKSGVGAYAAALDNQLYTGGLDIREGMVMSMANGTASRMGAAGGEIAVGAGAVLDMAGTYDHAQYRFVLNGGTLANSTSPASAWGKAMIADVRLGADSVIEHAGTYGVISNGYGSASLDLAGHALTIRGHKVFYFANVTSTAGTLVLDGPSYEFYRAPSDLRASDVIVNGHLHVNSNAGTLLLGNCVFNTPEPDVSVSYPGPIHVFGSLRPNTDYFHGCEMQDGSTLDLRGRTAPFFTRGRNAGDTNTLTTITFATNATVTIDVRGRELVEGMCLVKWNERPDATTTFAFDAETAAGGVAPFVADDGLYYGGDASTAYPAKATWTGAAGDGRLANPANWSCVNASGAALPGALPAATTELEISGDVALSAPPGSGAFSYARIAFDNARLSADSDLRGLGMLTMAGTLDLNGKTLRVAGLAGGGTIMSSFDLTVPDPERASTSTELLRDTKPENLFTNNFIRVMDAYHRLICTEANLPCVIDYDFGEQTLVTAYKIHIGPDDATSEQASRAPRDWQFFGSDDGEIWTLLDTRADVAGWAGWECRTFTFANTVAYRRYRLSITKAVKPGNGWMELVQLEYGLAESGCGTLLIDVPDGAATTNAAVAIDGNVRVEKTGGGLFVAAKARQGYNMGTIISEGGVLLAEPEAAIGRSKVVVRAGTTLDLGPSVSQAYGVYAMDLAGTVVATNVSTQRVFGEVALSGDARIVGRDDSFAFMNMAVAPSLLALNGHTLTIEANGFVYLGAWRDDGSGGRLLLKGPEGARFEATDGYGPASCAVEFSGGAVFKGYRDFDVGDFSYGGATWQLNSTASTLAVHGRFRPGEMYPALTMCGGSTLDLSAKTEMFDANGIAAVAGSGNPRTFTEPGLISFEPNSTVTVDVHGRTLQIGEKIVGWPQKPEGTMFAFDEATAAAGVAPLAGETGLFYGSAGVVDKAVWTGGGGDGDVANPANWSCVDAAGTVVQGALPGAGSLVRIEGSVAMQVPASAPLACERLEIGDCTLTADCDWRGLDFAECSGGTIDLHGHRLYVNGLGGEMTVTDTTEHYELLDYINVESGAWVNTGYTPDCTDRVHVKVRLANTSGNKCIYCSRTMNNNKVARTFTCFAINNNFRFDRNDSTTLSSLKLNATTDYELAVDNNTLDATINGGNAVKVGGTGMYTPGSPFILFSAHNASPGVSVSAPFAGRFYYFRVFNAEGNIVREYLPARRSTDGVIGLLETTRHEFLTNTSSTGALTAGANVICMRGLNPGELHVDVPQGMTNENYATVLAGNLRLVKEGEGTLVGGVSGQRYGGGTVVACGIARPRTAVQNSLAYYEAQYFWGGEYSRLTVDSGAVFDIAGHYAYRVHDIVLNGGTLANSGPDQTVEGYGGLGNVTLTADSTFDLPSSTVIFGGMTAAFKYSEGGRLELGGHTLTVRLGGDKTLRLGELALNGVFHMESGGWLRFFQIPSFHMPTLDLSLSGGAAIWAGIPNTVVRSFSMAETETVSRGIYPLDVLERCQPGGAGFYGCHVGKDAVLDLSQCRGELPAHSPNVWGCDATTYEPESTVTIHLAGRVVRNGERIVAWDSPPENVTFVLDDESRSVSRCSIIVQEDGIYVRKGLLIYFR